MLILGGWGGLILSAVWIYTGIQGSFLLLCFYPVLQRFERLMKPWLLWGAMTFLCWFLFFFWPAGWMTGTIIHFPFYWGMFTLLYLLNLKRFGYKGANAFLLTVVPLLALNAIWEFPWFVHDWIWNGDFIVGLSTAGWDLSSVPILLYLVLKIKGSLFLGVGGVVLIALTGISSLMFIFAPVIYGMSFGGFRIADAFLFAWFLFLITLVRPNPWSGPPSSTYRA